MNIPLNRYLPLSEHECLLQASRDRYAILLRVPSVLLPLLTVILLLIVKIIGYFVLLDLIDRYFYCLSRDSEWNLFACD